MIIIATLIMIRRQYLYILSIRMIMLTIITNNQVKQHNTNSKTTNSNKSNSLVLRPCRHGGGTHSFVMIHSIFPNQVSCALCEFVVTGLQDEPFYKGFIGIGYPCAMLQIRIQPPRRLH